MPPPFGCHTILNCLTWTKVVLSQSRSGHPPSTLRFNLMISMISILKFQTCPFNINNLQFSHCRGELIVIKEEDKQLGQTNRRTNTYLNYWLIPAKDRNQWIMTWLYIYISAFPRKPPYLLCTHFHKPKKIKYERII